MSKNLVIVESPSKSKTIEKYLGKDYKVLSSKGHVRDLSKSGKYGLGVDIENDFNPKYVVMKDKKDIVRELKKEIKKVDFVYLATDPDREGEAISWHLFDCLDLTEDNYERVVFNEITKKAVTEAFHHTRKIDNEMVNSQETRRILDRIIGFRLSKLVQSKTDAKSAGRVQSVALKLIVDKEREIEAFNEEEYWTIDADFNDFEANLFNYDHKEIQIKTEHEANQILEQLSKTFEIESVEKKEKTKKSKNPYTTSTLQQDASNKLGMNAKKTMSVAQKLYEGIDLENETAGLITYMRTDSIRLSEEFVDSAKNYIKGKFGEEYVGNVKISKKKDNVQDAHEAIRPTDIKNHPIDVKPYLSNDEYKLYKMIYSRALASIMADAKTENTTVVLNNNNYQFKATGQIITYDGYLKVYGEFEDTKDKVLPSLDADGFNLFSNKIEKEQHFTKPPARYTEAKLIKEMEELGIGRPSTYAKTMDTINTRGYVNIIEKKFHPTEVGIELTDKLQEHFSNIINVEYTANMENDLDKISEGELLWTKVLKDFYDKFEPALQEAFDSMPKKEAKETGELCPECGHPLVFRKGRYGEFVACSNFPECKYIKAEPREETEITKCPNCEEGMIVEKKSRKGKIFYGCNNYPTCKTAYWDIPTGESCPECGKMITRKKDIEKCSECNYQK